MGVRPQIRSLHRAVTEMFVNLRDLYTAEVKPFKQSVVMNVIIQRSLARLTMNSKVRPNSNLKIMNSTKK